MNCEDHVEECPIVRTMSPDERNHFLELAEYRTYQTGDTVLRQGQLTPQGLWAVRSGSCAVQRQFSNGTEQQIALLESGATFGEMSFFDSAPHSATVRAVQPLEVMFFPIEKFTTLEAVDLLAAAKLLRNMGRMLSTKLRRMDDRSLGMLYAARAQPSTTPLSS